MAGPNTLTNNNGVTYGPAVISNGAYLESASVQTLSHSDNASLSITGDMTFVGWFYFTNFGASGTKIAGKWEDTGNQRGGYLIIRKAQVAL